jgi:hypothetical protein
MDDGFDHIFNKALDLYEQFQAKRQRERPRMSQVRYRNRYVYKHSL